MNEKMYSRGILYTLKSASVYNSANCTRRRKKKEELVAIHGESCDSVERTRVIGTLRTVVAWCDVG